MMPYCILAIEDDNDRAYMEGLVQEYKRLLYSEIRKIITDRWAVDDIYQMVWEKLIDKIALLRSRDRTRRVSYIISTAHNTALNYLRDNKRPKESSFEDYIDISDSENDGHQIENRLIEEAEMDNFSRIWAKLDDRSRYILGGYYILEKSMPEIAKELVTQPKSVRMALTRARKSAYMLMKNEMEPQR